MSTVIDPLLIDIYEYDLDGKPDIAKLVSAGLPWCGMILKATEGTYYNGGVWLQTYWPLACSLAGARYGSTWFRGAYHYVNIGECGVAQADYFLCHVQRVGGWGIGDLWPILDVEGSGQPANATKQQIIDVVSACATRILASTGRAPMLYGGSYLRDFGITDHMGCQALWIPRWTSTLPAEAYLSMGWTLADTWGWQYCGDGTAYLAGYPHMSPIGPTDITAIIIHGGGDPQAEIAWTRTHIGTQIK
jgi:GH25 family lysozyme M1 (1,4-beta-N-acetylmuramidase)